MKNEMGKETKKDNLEFIIISALILLTIGIMIIIVMV